MFRKEEWNMTGIDDHDLESRYKHVEKDVNSAEQCARFDTCCFLIIFQLTCFFST